MQYKPQLELYAHQAKAVSKIYDEEAFALFMAMRTGKSAVIITEFGMKLVNDEVSNLLIIAPAGAYRTWEVELRKHMNPSWPLALSIPGYTDYDPNTVPQSCTGA